MPHLSRRSGFTLIELLIVVAIIAILAAIAVPNFLEAQVRSKVSRCKSDMRTIATALEAYFVDANKYPDVPRTSITPPIKLGIPYSRASLTKLSTPVAYISNGLLTDPFAIGSIDTTFFGFANSRATETSPDLAAVGVASPTVEQRSLFDQQRFVLQSVGPDTRNFALQVGNPNQNFPLAFNALTTQNLPNALGFFYDPTNGTISVGDVVRTAKLTN